MERTQDPGEPAEGHGPAGAQDSPRMDEMERPVELPHTGEVIEDRRVAHPGRREHDRGPHFSQLRAAFWAIVGSIVVLYLFFVALDAVNPREVQTASIIVLVLAVLWLAHAWRRIFTTGGGSRSDRERRGF